MEKVIVEEVDRIRDGGTIVYRDAHNRKYYVPGFLHKDNSIYGSYHYHGTKSEEYRGGIRLTGIELVIVEKL